MFKNRFLINQRLDIKNVSFIDFVPFIFLLWYFHELLNW